MGNPVNWFTIILYIFGVIGLISVVLAVIAAVYVRNGGEIVFRYEEGDDEEE